MFRSAFESIITVRHDFQLSPNKMANRRGLDDNEWRIWYIKIFLKMNVPGTLEVPGTVCSSVPGTFWVPGTFIIQCSQDKPFSLV